MILNKKIDYVRCGQLTVDKFPYPNCKNIDVKISNTFKHKSYSKLLEYFKLIPQF